MTNTSHSHRAECSSVSIWAIESHATSTGAFFDAVLETGEVIVTSRQPVFDGARELLRRGHAPSEILHAHTRDGMLSFKPAPLANFAYWTIEEADKTGLRRRKWRQDARSCWARAVEDERDGDL